MKSNCQISLSHLVLSIPALSSPLSPFQCLVRELAAVALFLKLFGALSFRQFSTLFANPTVCMADFSFSKTRLVH